LRALLRRARTREKTDPAAQRRRYYDLISNGLRDQCRVSRSAAKVTSHTTLHGAKTHSAEAAKLCSPGRKGWVASSKTNSPGGATQEIAPQRKSTGVEAPSTSLVEASAAEQSPVSRNRLCRKTAWTKNSGRKRALKNNGKRTPERIQRQGSEPHKRVGFLAVPNRILRGPPRAVIF